ncbi:MAG: endonuclease/exonuclease/phosphatase family protein [Blastocatellia bacterium]
MFLSIIQLSLVSVLLLSLAGYLGRSHRYAELTSHFRVQYLLASAACLALCLFYEEWGWASGAALGVALNLVAVAPWYAGGNKRASNGRRVKLMLANVNSANTRCEDFIAFAQGHAPDVLVVQEVNDAWYGALESLQRHYPFSEAHPRDGGSGMALYSRFRFERSTIVLPEGDARPCILVKMDIDGVSLSLLSLHPRTPTRNGHFELRNGMFTDAADVLRNLPAPKICIGDLNITPWSPYYRSFVEQTKLINVRKGFGLLPSWPTFLFFKWLMIPLDHCLVSDDIRVADVRTGESNGSDHLPLIVELELEVER